MQDKKTISISIQITQNHSNPKIEFQIPHILERNEARPINPYH